MKYNKIICFDFDNTICKTYGNNYLKSILIKKNVKSINKLFLKGYYIKIFTARYMGRSKENAKLAKQMGFKKTINQLNKWNIKYNELIFGKPTCDILVDDKSLFYKKNWSKELKKTLIN